MIDGNINFLSLAVVFYSALQLLAAA